MGVYHFRTGGTKVAGDGYSTPGDWTNANCYANPSVPLWEPWVDGDEIIGDDQSFAFSALNVNNAVSAGTEIIIRSRSGNPANAIMGFNNATNTPISHGKTFKIRFQGWTIKKTLTHTSASAGLLATSANGNVDFENCLFPAQTINSASAGLGWFSMPFPSTSKIRFLDCIIEDLTTTFAGGTYFCNGGGSSSMEFIRTTVRRLTNTSTGNNDIDGGCNLGIIHIEESIFESVNSTNQSALTTSAHIGFLRPNQLFTTPSNGKVHVTVNSCYATGGTCGPFIMAFGPFSWDGMRFFDRVATQVGNTIGGCFCAYGDSAQGTGNNLQARKCKSDYGAALYVSQGGGGIFTNIHAIDCENTTSGPIYFGGWGDVSLDGFSIIGCRAVTYPQFVANYGVLYAHLHPSTTRDAVRGIKNGFIDAPMVPNDQHVIVIKSAAIGYSHSVQMDNVEVRARATPVFVEESSGANLIVSGQIACDNAVITTSRAGIGYGSLSVVRATGKRARGASRGLETIRRAA